MTTWIKTTVSAPVVVPMSSGRSLAASRLLGAGSPIAGGSDLRGASVLMNAHAAAEAFHALERPTSAPVAEAAWVPGSASVAAGAGHRTQSACGYAVTQQFHSKKRAFRGLEPWRDPA